MIHVVALFLLLFEPRYSWRTTLLAGFAGASTLLIVNVLAMLWLGHGIIMTLAFFTCTIPTLILFLFLSKYRDLLLAAANHQLSGQNNRRYLRYNVN